VRAEKRTLKQARHLRRSMSLPEVALWRLLRRRQLEGFRFRRQHPVGPYILDFYCPMAKLAIEVDGIGHWVGGRAHRDATRDVWLNEKGIRVLRVPAAAVLRETDLDGVANMILGTINAPSTAFGGPPPPLRRGGTRSRGAKLSCAMKPLARMAFPGSRRLSCSYFVLIDSEEQSGSQGKACRKRIPHERPPRKDLDDRR
jgi:very-short-patch-repair endonuclease